MSVFFLISHPARVHLFKHVIHELEDDGIDTHVFVRDRDLICELLAANDIQYEIWSNEHTSLLELMREQSKFEINTLLKSSQLSPKLIIGGFGSPIIAKIVGAKSIGFFDTDHLTRMNSFQAQFLDRIYTPESYRLDHGRKHVRYPSYHELAYLHPNRFTPDPEILQNHGIDKDDKIVILRLVNWNAVHDVGDSGIRDVTDVVEYLEDTGARVVITAEGAVPESLADKQLSMEPQNIHHLLYYADLFLGESATMAIECAVLGTPSIYISTLEAGVLNELETRYNLLFRFSDDQRQGKALNRAKSILTKDTTRWEKQRERLLEEKIDTTDYIVTQIKKVVSSD